MKTTLGAGCLSAWEQLWRHSKYDNVNTSNLETDMDEIERLTTTMPAEMAAIVKQAVDTGDYASSSEVVRAALPDWKDKRGLPLEGLTSLKAAIDLGLSDVAAGRVRDFDVDRIVERGKNLLVSRSVST
jgi:antitoxin ParD1/3/4